MLLRFLKHNLPHQRMITMYSIFDIYLYIYQSFFLSYCMKEKGKKNEEVRVQEERRKKERKNKS